MAARFSLVLLLFFPTFSLSVGMIPPAGQESSSSEAPLMEARELIDGRLYQEAEQVLREILRKQPKLIEGHFLLGFTLAKQGKWLASKEALERVVSLDPFHGRAHTELAGVEFKLGNRKKAIRHLEQAEKLGSDVEYVRTFLATLLYLEDNKTAALYYWNKVGKPRVEKISYRTSDSVAPDLLQNLFTLNEGEIFRRRQLLDIRWKQRRFQLGSPMKWYITPQTKDNYDLQVILPSTSHLSSPKVLLVENAIRIPLYRQVAVHYPVSLRNGRSISGSFRWEEPRKRIRLSACVPFVSSSNDKLALGFDWRDEQWTHHPSGNEFPLETRALLASYESIFGERKSLLFRGGYKSQTGLLPETSNLPQDRHFALIGTRWNQLFSLNESDDLQLHIRAALDGLFGHGSEASRSGQLQTTLELRWLIERSTRNEFRLALGVGYAGSSTPLADHFILGIGQDNPLPLRAHPTVDQGRKGASPMGRQFMLANLELHRRMLNLGVLELGALVFSDTALVGGAPFEEPGQRWFQDVGFGFRLGALGREYLEVLFGFDLEDSDFNLWVGIPLVRW